MGACFVEVEVDTWTGDWRFLRAVYTHDTGLIINPLVSEADMVGSLMESTQVATDPIPWDREFPGTRHYSVGYLSYRLPTIMDLPKSTQVYIDSLEPRWFYGVKSFSETTIGAVPGAISNAIYNASGVRIREHPITREKIMAGLASKASRKPLADAHETPVSRPPLANARGSETPVPRAPLTDAHEASVPSRDGNGAVGKHAGRQA